MTPIINFLIKPFLYFCIIIKILFLNESFLAFRWYLGHCLWSLVCSDFALFLHVRLSPAAKALQVSNTNLSAENRPEFVYVRKLDDLHFSFFLTIWTQHTFVISWYKCSNTAITHIDNAKKKTDQSWTLLKIKLSFLHRFNSDSRQNVIYKPATKEDV